MASWEDGPEYAPIERPTHFADAGAPPLPVAPPAVQMAARAPKERPLFDQPPTPLAPLEALVPAPEETRDPQVPFAVVSAAMTSDSAWGAVHSGPPTTPPASSRSLAAPTGPAGMPAPLPTSPGPWPAGPTSAPPPDSRFPAPGTPAWFGPGPYGGQPAPPGRVSAKAVWDAAMPGLCICLAVGGLVYLLAPILYAIAFGLSGRVLVARQQVRNAFVLGSVGLGLVAIVAVLTNDFGFGEWWSTVAVWSLLACWALLVTTLVLVYRALRAGEQPEPAYRSTW
ncbi:MAG TPA: hypothetical protein VE617_13540 [Propionibacteriaceae bacterium]|nr:hypothetical protein [Propionibacteriaceae bacterium]